MKKIFILFSLILICLQITSQTIVPIEICETKVVANIDKNRNQVLHTSPPTLNTGFQHNFPIPTISPPPACDGNLTGIFVRTDITSLTDTTAAFNAGNTPPTDCNLVGWFIDVFYDCGGPSCQVIQQVNGGCGPNTPVTNVGPQNLEIIGCGNPLPNSIVNIDIMPAMDYGASDCPGIDEALLNGWVDIEYTLCVEFQYTVFDPPVAVASNTGPYCFGDDIQLEVDEPDFDYDWSGPNGFTSTIQNPSINNANDMDSGTYTVTVTSVPGCETVLTTNVVVAEEIEVMVIDQEDPSCNGVADGIGEVSASGGFGNYDFDWTDGFTGDFVDQLEGDVLYTIMVTDDEGCEGSTTLILNEPDLLELTLIDSRDPSCPGAMDGEADFFASGGDNSYDYFWNPGGFIDPIVSTLSGGITYSVTVFDGNDCEAVATVTLNDPPPVNIQFSNTGPFCLENLNHQITATPSPGTFSGATDANGNFNPSTLGVGTHRVYYEPDGPANCPAIDSVDILITTPVPVTFGDSVFCESETAVTLTASPSPGAWFGVGIDASGNINPSSLGVGFHTFSYDYTDPTNNCITTREIMVEVEAQPNIVIMGDNDFCQSTGIQAFTATPPGGTWGGVVDATGQVDAATLAVGSHDVTYAVTNGTCSNTSTLTINVTAAPTATMSGGGTICPGGTVDANLDFVLTGTGPWTIEFTLDGVAQIPINATGSPHQHSVGQPGTYEITSVTDASGCVGTVSGMATVTQIMPLAISNIQTQCDPTNTNYILTFEITGGDPATYLVAGATGSISPTAPFIFTSLNIPQGTTTNFTVSDNSACASVSDNVTVNCACTTEVGTMDQAPISICGTGTATATYDNTNEVLDGDDITQFVLHTNAGISLGTIIATNGTPSFAFGGGIVFGTTYYISAIVGNNNGGNVDLTDPCLKIAQGTPVVFNETPTATLSGGGTICAGESATLTFTLTGTAPWNIQYSDGANTIDLNGINTNPIDITVMPTTTTNYSIISIGTSACPGTSSGMATVTVNTPATATVTPSIGVCNSSQSGMPTALDFSTLITAGDMTGSWVDVDNSGAAGTLPNLDFDGVTPGDYTFRYTTAAAQAPCTNVSSLITVTVRDCACPSVLTTGAGPFCNNDARLDLTTITLTTEAGSWSILTEPAGSTASLTGSIFNANNSVAGNYELEFRLTNSVMGCPESSTQTIQIFEQPTATVIPTGSICNSSQSGEPTMLDFSTLITTGNTTGTWTDVNTSGATGTFPNLDFENVTPGDYNFRYTLSAQAPCVDASFDVTITVRDCACPSVETTGAGPFCNDDAMIDLADLTLTTEAGTWDIISQPTGAGLTLSGNNFNGNGAPTGDYELEFTLDNPVMGCPTSSIQTIQIFAPPSATVTTSAEVCNSSQSGDPTTFDFDNLITAGDMTGSWTDIDNSGATGAFPILDFDNIAPGNYNFRYETNSAQAPCVEATYDVTITVRDCACPSVLTTGAGPLCNDDATIDLADLVLTMEVGTWDIISQPTGAGLTLSGNNFNANSAPAGDYVLEFTLDNPVMGCPNSSTQTIQIFAPPSATVTTAAAVCNSSQSGEPTTFDFDDLITAGDMTGSWTDLDNSGATGSFPNLDFENIPIGDYNFRYTLSAQSPCDDTTFDVTITVRDCACPSVQTTGAGPFCNDDARIDLADLTVTTEPGSWSILSRPAGSNINITGNILDATMSPAGDYELQFTLTNQVMGCPAFSNQTIQIFAPPSATVTTSAEVCNSSQSGDPTMFDFDDLITAGDMNGTWTDVDNSGATGSFPNLDFNNIAIGNYIFRYTTNSAQAPCSETTYDVTITVRDCACPSVLTTGAGPFCNDNAMIDLADLTLTMEAGTWNIISQPTGAGLTLSGNNFNGNDAPTGGYELEFTLDVPVTGCPSSSTQTIEIVAAPSAGNLIQDLELCEGQDTLISLFDLIENFDMGGNWIENSLNPVTAAFDPTSGTFISNGVGTDTYVFEYLVDGGGVCADASTTVEITINENPTADAGMDSEINCDDTEVSLGGSSTLGAQYSWSGTVNDPTAANTTTSRPDTYILTVTNSAGCSATDEVVVTVSSDFPLLDANALQIECFGDNDGVIQINNVTGGLPPFMFSLNGAAFTDQNTFDNLTPGIYSLVLEDANGCQDSTSFDILEPNQFTVTLSGNGSNIIQLGESVQLTAVGSEAIDSIVWSPDAEFDVCDPTTDPDCLSQLVSPGAATTYSIIAFNAAGCEAVANLTLQVENTEDGVFTPNAFSPNNDGINDIFLPFTNQTVAVIKSFMVYDRWGEPVHKAFDIEPNDLSGGWDGTFKGNVLNTAVFVWFVEVEYNNGTTRLFEGDVTLFR